MKKAAVASVPLLALCLALPAAAQTSGPSTGPYDTIRNQTPSGSNIEPTGAPDTTPGQSAELSRQDRKFVEKAAIGGMAEVQMGQLASQRAQSQAAREFANRMIADHTPANQRLMSLARSMNVETPAELDFKHRRMMKKLERADAAEVDREYIKSQVKAHEQMIELMEKQMESGENQQLKQYASEMLPVLREHLQMAQRIEQQLQQQ